jgi:outer membrane autotransporter protein
MNNVFPPALSRIALVATFAASILLASSDRGLAASGSWLAAPTNGNWEPAAGETNWTNGTGVGAFPGSTFGVTNTDVATFNVVSTFTTITINNPGPAFLNLGGMTFTGTPSNYTIGSTGGQGIFLTSGGTIQIDSALTATNAIETINAPLAFNAGTQSYTFTNNSANGSGAGAGTLIFGGDIANPSIGVGPGSVALTLTGSNTNLNTISGNISDGGSGTSSITKTGAGMWVLSGSNTYSGGTTINSGTLTVNNLNALGNGDVNLHDGTLQTPDNTPQTFNVNGGTGYSQDFGTLRIQIGGTSSGFNSDLMAVTNTATLSTGNFSTLFLHRIFNFNPAPGDMVQIITAGNTITTTFDNVTNDFPGLIQPHVIYDPNDVTVVFQLGSFTSVPGLTFNQNSVAVALNKAFADACLPLSTFTILGNRPIATLPHIFDLIAPEEFAAMYEISFSRAVVQSGNLQGRMDQIRENADPNCGPIVEINPPIQEGKNVVGKNVVPPAPAPGPDNRWGTFAMGSGDYVTVHNQDDNADGYKITNGSFLAGVDYRLLHNLAIGVYGGYVGSESNLIGNGRIITDGETVGGYATFFCHGFYLQASGGGGWNNYENRREAFLTAAQSSTTGSEVNAMGALGYDWTMNFNAANHPGSLTVGPIASVQYTNVNIDGFRERGSLIPLEFPDQSEDSLRSTIGGKVAICLQTDHGIMLRPEARVAWLHEYNDRAYPIDARFIGCDDLFTVRGPRIGGDAAQVTAGLTVQFNPMVALFAHYEGIFGRDNYDSNGVSGGLALSF